VARYRLTKSARGDIDSILRTSEQRHGRDARARYGALLIAAMRRVAADPEEHLTSDRSELV
jgi:toxin ParE1/3/4